MKKVSKASRVATKEPAAKPNRKPKAGPGRRGRGRPAGAESGLLDGAMILSIALQLAKSVPLAELSIVRLANELGVTPALIHYYLGGRDALTSGVMNSFYKEVIETWPKDPGNNDWRHRLEIVAGAVYRAHVRYPGIAAYVVSNNRYRMIQEVKKGEMDYGILFFEYFTSVVKSIGFDAALTGTYSHLLMEFITSNAHATVRHMWPGEHKDFLESKLSALDPDMYPATYFVRSSLTRLNASAAFSAGLNLILKALEMSLPKSRLR